MERDSAKRFYGCILFNFFFILVFFFQCPFSGEFFLVFMCLCLCESFGRGAFGVLGRWREKEGRGGGERVYEFFFSFFVFS